MDNQRTTEKNVPESVVSDRMQKTVVVTVERTVTHPKYKKILRRRAKVKAHDETNQCRSRRSRVDRRMPAVQPR